MFRPVKVTFRFLLERNERLVLCIVLALQLLLMWCVYWIVLPVLALCEFCVKNRAVGDGVVV